MDIDDLWALEHRGWQSLCDGTGAEFYREIMTEDGVMVLAHGAILGRDEVADSLAHAPPWSSYRIEQPQVVTLAGDSVALVYRGTATRDGEGEPFRALMVSVYVQRDGGTRLALYQQTPVSPT